MTSLQEARPAAPARLVLDTNVVLDALLFDNAEVAPLWRAISDRRLAWLACPRMREEFALQIERPALRRRSVDSERMLTEFDRQVSMVADPPSLPAGLARLRCRDGDDQCFVDLAWHTRCDALLTRDRDLLALARKARSLGLQIALPGPWWAQQPCRP